MTAMPLPGGSNPAPQQRLGVGFGEANPRNADLAGINHRAYRKFVSLGNGKKLMFRFLNGEDQTSIAQLFQEAGDEDTRFCLENFKDPGVLEEWLHKLDYRRLLPLVAVELDSQRLVGSANLYMGKYAARHIGEISFFVAEPFRNLGLGSLMVNELLALATRQGLRWLRVAIVAEQKKLISAFRAKGFQVKAILEDFFLRRNGVTHDVVLMMRPVFPEGEPEF